ncbi:MAG: aldo/keto reductase [Sphingomonadales bacterium]
MRKLALPFPTRLLGKSGIVASSMAWGMWRFAGRSVSDARALVEAALDGGITLLDTADIYGFNGSDGFGDAEALLGQVLKDAPALRDRMVLASKGGIAPPLPYDSSPAYLDAALEASLRRLGTTRIDLYQIHRPDILTHPHEIAKFAEKAFVQGKIGAFGVSNYTVAQTNALIAAMPQHGIPLSTIQPELSPLCIDTITDGTLDMALQHDLAPMAWSPLGGGRIANPEDGRSKTVAAALDAVAEAQGISRTAVTYAWIMAHPAHPIPIVGSQHVDRIREAADAYKVQWTREDWYKVLVASRGEKLP